MFATLIIGKWWGNPPQQSYQEGNSEGWVNLKIETYEKNTKVAPQREV